MQFLLASVQITLLVIAALAAFINWGAVLTGISYRRRGINRSVTGMAFVPQIFVLLALAIAPLLQTFQIPHWVFWLIAFGDTSIPLAIYLLIGSVWRRLKGQT